MILRHTNFSAGIYPGGATPTQSGLACSNIEILKHPYCMDASVWLNLPPPIKGHFTPFTAIFTCIAIGPKNAPIPHTFCHFWHCFNQIHTSHGIWIILPPFCVYTLPHNLSILNPPFHTEFCSSMLVHFGLSRFQYDSGAVCKQNNNNSNSTWVRSLYRIIKELD